MGDRDRRTKGRQNDRQKTEWEKWGFNSELKGERGVKVEEKAIKLKEEEKAGNE